MIAKTGAGWRVERPGSRNLTTIHAAAGHSFTVKKGAGGNVSRAMAWLIDELNKIEPIGEPGWDGTYAYRPVRGGSNWSEHAAGVALDWNASQHPMGSQPLRYPGWSAEQSRSIRILLRSPRGLAFKWGADFLNRPDSMHFELRSPSVWLKKRRLF